MIINFRGKVRTKEDARLRKRVTDKSSLETRPDPNAENTPNDRGNRVSPYHVQNNDDNRKGRQKRYQTSLSRIGIRVSVPTYRRRTVAVGTRLPLPQYGRHYYQAGREM